MSERMATCLIPWNELVASVLPGSHGDAQLPRTGSIFSINQSPMMRAAFMYLSGSEAGALKAKGPVSITKSVTTTITNSGFRLTKSLPHNIYIHGLPFPTPKTEL